MPSTANPDPHSSDNENISEDEHELLDPILKAACGTSLTIHPYTKLTPVIAAGIPAIRSVLGDDSEDEENGSEVDHAEEVRIFRGLCKLIPHFEDIILACSRNMYVLGSFVRILEEASHNGRSMDVHSITHTIVEWVELDDRIEYDKDQYPMPKAKEMDRRAWWHPEYAILAYPLLGQQDLICPKMFSDKLYSLANGKLDVSESEWLYYLYAPDMVFNPLDDLNGLFHGYLVSIVY
ncbi:hypothetical protein CPC08DRAFT_763596 [Agrocybe pediades]|nr:hypothetical protein CPC08DRAFT_763596 [Agrocybe pediades]